MMASKKGEKKDVGEERTPTCEDCGAELKKRDFMVPKRDFMDGDYYCPRCYGDDIETTHVIATEDFQGHLIQIGDDDLYFIADLEAAAKSDLSQGAEPLSYWQDKAFVKEIPEFIKQVKLQKEDLQKNVANLSAVEREMLDDMINDMINILSRWWSMTLDEFNEWIKAESKSDLEKFRHIRYIRENILDDEGDGASDLKTEIRALFKAAQSARRHHGNKQQEAIQEGLDAAAYNHQGSMSMAKDFEDRLANIIDEYDIDMEGVE